MTTGTTKLCFLRLFGAILAGVSISIGGTAYLSITSPVTGAILFAVGLYVICDHGFELFTGKAGYLIDRSISPIDLIVVWIGNLIGTIAAGACIRAIKGDAIIQRAQAVCAQKLECDYLSLLAMAVFCGLLMYAAVDGYKHKRNPILLLMCVSAFILCGFEHCIADMFYFTAAGVWSVDSFCRLVVISVGNVIGCIAIPTYNALQPRFDPF